MNPLQKKIWNIILRFFRHNGPEGVQQASTVIDPATQLPVARNLRFRRFVAHQREFYFLNDH